MDPGRSTGTPGRPGEDRIEQFNRQHSKTNAIQSEVLKLGDQRYHLLDAGGGHAAEELFRKTQGMFEGATLQWPERGSKESVLKFMEETMQLLCEVHGVEVPGVGDQLRRSAWSGGESQDNCYNVQCLLRVFLQILDKLDSRTVESINFEAWLRYVPGQKNRCTELGKKTYGSVAQEFQPLTPTEVCAWADYLYSKDTEWLKAMADADPNTAWEKFAGLRVKGDDPSELVDLVFEPGLTRAGRCTQG